MLERRALPLLLRANFELRFRASAGIGSLFGCLHIAATTGVGERSRQRPPATSVRKPSRLQRSAYERRPIKQMNVKARASVADRRSRGGESNVGRAFCYAPGPCTI